MKIHLIVASALAALLLGSQQAAARDADALPGSSPMRWSPDQQIVGYREMARIAPVRMVARGGQVHGLPLAIHQISPRWTWKGEAMDLDRYMETQRASGVIVLKDGAVVLERYAFGRTAKDRWQSQSVAKSITSILVGAAIQDGYIKSLDSKVVDYLPELKGSAFEGVTLRHLLTMTSGVKWNEDYTDSKSDVNQLFHGPLVNDVDPVIALASHMTRAHPPGTTYAYKGIDPELAGRIVSRVTGRSLSEYLSIRLWKPYGMEEAAFWQTDPAGQEYSECCVQATLRDFARVGQFMIDGGRIGDRQVLPPNYLQESVTPLAPGFNANGPDVIGYGYYWWPARHDGFMAIGLEGQAIAIFPKERLVIAINSAWPNSGSEQEYQRARTASTEARVAFIDAVRQMVGERGVGPIRTDCDGC